MTELSYHTLDVFTDRRYTGNPLAVVLEADALTTGQMQVIAREFNLSETVFVQKAAPGSARFAVRIFTPSVEMPFAGHPTVGTACLLAELDLAPLGDVVDIVLEEKVGPVSVSVTRAAGRPPFAQLTTAKLPEYGPPVPALADIAAMLGLPPAEVVTGGDRVRACSCGVPFLLVPVSDLAALSRIRVDAARLAATLRDYWAKGVYAYTREAENETAQLRARMFAPDLGVGEDPATGAAAVALAGALAMESAQRDGRLQWVIEQGVEMGRPSRLHIEADKQGGKVTAVRVGGYAVRVSAGYIQIPA